MVAEALFSLLFLVCCAAATAVFRDRDYPLAEAGCCGIMTAMMSLSLGLQVGVLTGSLWIGRILVGAWGVAGLTLLFRHRRQWAAAQRSIRFALDAFPLALVLVAAAWILPTVATMKGVSAAGGMTVAQNAFRISCPMPLLNHWVLPRAFFLLFGLPTTLPIGVAAYVAISFGVYAVARRYAWPRTAVTVALIVVSMPRLMPATMGEGTEIIHAATALFCLLTVHRSVESPNPGDLTLLVWGLLFGLSHQPMTPEFQAIFAALAALLLFRRHGVMTWRAILRGRSGSVAAVLGVAVLFSQIGTLILSRIGCGLWSPALPASFYNIDGLAGAMVNLARYALEAAHFTAPVDRLMHWLFGFSWHELLVWMQGVFIPEAARRLGAAVPFVLPPVPDVAAAWFGIQGFLLIIPTLIYSAVRGHRRIKALAVALLGYGYVIALAVSWRPGNAGHFTPVFVCGGVCLALVLPPWRITSRGRRWIQWLCAAMLVHAFWGMSGGVFGF